MREPRNDTTRSAFSSWVLAVSALLLMGASGWETERAVQVAIFLGCAVLAAYALQGKRP